MSEQNHDSPQALRRRRSTDPLRITPQETDTHQTSLLDTTDAPPDSGEPVEANLIVIAHPESAVLGRRFRLGPHSSVEIGRSSSVEVSLPDVLSVSRRHARLTYDGATVELEDLESTNGTYRNDQRVSSRVLLESGDRFQVGTVHFKFLREQDPEHAYHRAIYHLVTHDGLTEIYNQRKFSEDLDQEFSRAQRYERPLSLVLFDIDRFKDVNDRFGHLCGDFTLKRIAVLVKDELRPEQVFARVGGEEFAVLCPETDEHGAYALAERLRDRIATAPFRFAEVEVKVRCSFGVAGRRADLANADELYALADRALYRSKHSGRNRTTAASELSDDAVPPVA